MLGALAAVLPAGRVPASLQFSGSELRAGGMALAPNELEQVSAQLKALGYGASAEGSTLVVTAEDAR